MSRGPLITGAILIALLSGCSVRQHYTVPTTPMTPSYKEVPPEAFKENSGWKPAAPGDTGIRANWWEVFGDPELNKLEERVATGNQTLKIAEARFREARAMVRYNRAAQVPTISVGPSLGAIRNSANRPGLPSTIGGITSGNFLLPFDLSYEVDLWGRVRGSIAAAGNEAQASAADLQTAILSIQAELAFDYFELRAADLQSKILHDTVETFSKSLELATNRFNGGVAPKSDVSQAKTQLETARVQETDIEADRQRYEHAIAILIGEPPASFTMAASPVLPKPPGIPLGIPSQLLERRPDIAAMERRVAEANEQIGLARMAFYPQLMLGATGGLQGTSIVNWFTWPSRVWSVGPTLAQTLFDGGRRRSVSDSAIAAYDATAAIYRQTTLSAFQQVEDNVAALRVLEKEAVQQRDAIAAATEFLEQASNRYKGGVDTYLQVLTAQTLTLSNQRNAADIQRRQMAASVLLIKALGGGWSASQLPAVKDIR